MFKKIIFMALATTFAFSAAAVERTPGISYTRDAAGNVTIHEPLRVTFDAEQQASLQKAIVLISAQLKSLEALRDQDPNGDLKSISVAIDNLNTKLDMLLTVAAKLYTEINPFTFKLFQTLPTAVIVFGGASADKNVFKFLSLGGSAAGAIVLVPERETKISAVGQVIETKINWSSNSSLVLMGLGLVGGKVSTSTALPGADAIPATNTTSKSPRGGVGFVWGELNNASELTGLAYGGTATINLGLNVNGKLLALKNKDKSGAINNYVLLIGVQPSAPLTGKIPFTEIDAEIGANVGMFVDAGSLASSASGFAKDFGAMLTGQRGGSDATLSRNKTKEATE